MSPKRGKEQKNRFTDEHKRENLSQTKHIIQMAKPNSMLKDDVRS